MADVYTRIADSIVPSVFHKYSMEKTAEKSAFFQSGVFMADAKITADLQGGGRTFEVPFWTDLGNDEANVSDDDPSIKSETSNVSASKDSCIRNNRNKTWGIMDLTANLAGDDPMDHIVSRVGDYWARQYQKTAISQMNGVIASNIANNGGDMIHDVATDDAGAITEAEMLTEDTILEGMQTLGDGLNDLAAIAMHSRLYTNLRKRNLIDFIPPSRGEINFPTYMGLTVIVDDGMPAIAGTNRPTYTTGLFKKGVFATGEGTPRTPVAYDRDEKAGNGGGLEELTSRREFVLHPRGIKYTDAVCAKVSPTNAEFANAANWNRVYERKNVGMAFIRTNG